jgi:alanyl-tRNA synthetase
MKYLTANEIRRAFLQYFEKQGHAIVESSSLVPHGDPTLLFTNAGMNQFKDTFLGADERSYLRATSSQKCLRAGGKHNDLENVGFTNRHHTFFEMLGNFSFGDYFKEEAIHYAWDLITNYFEIPKEKLFVTVYKDDDEAAEIWQKQEGVPQERIYRFDETDNFWQMGDTGPCGPCSEIFYDLGPEVDPKEGGVGVSDRYVEIWNLVFMQYNRDEKGILHPLPKPSVDTGMGLERIASVLQGKKSNYETGLFQLIIKKIAEISKQSYGENDQKDASMHVIADHLRAASFLIADGVLPSNEGRGYVLRRILRRGIRHGKKLNLNKPFFSKLTGTLIQLMGDAYPELADKKSFIDEVIRNEEEKFLETLDKGLQILNEEFAKLGKKKTVPGTLVFKLYDTFGFPVDLTRVIASERGFDVDEATFEKEMEAQRKRSGAFKVEDGHSQRETLDQLYKEIHDRLRKEKGNGFQNFTGYESSEEKDCRLLAIIFEGKEVLSAEAQNSTTVELVFDKTPFYGESGGQVGDTGLALGGGAEIRIRNTIKPLEDFIVMRGQIEKGQIKVGESFYLKVDEERRKLITCNHTATHLLHAALRNVLGDHVKQAGSLVAADRLRFDYTHYQATSAGELRKIEDMVNEKIHESIESEIQVMPKEEAFKKGALAFFGEKYGTEVRTIRISDYSMELCGGTHVSNTSQIRLFKITSDQSIASGIRRIEAVTSKYAFQWLNEQHEKLTKLEKTLESTGDETFPKLQRLLEQNKALEKQVKEFEKQKLSQSARAWISEAEEFSIQGLSAKVLMKTAEVDDAKKLRDLSSQLLGKLKTGVVILGTPLEDGKKAMFQVEVSKDLVKQGLKAGDLVKSVAPAFGGKGGGRPEMAQAGGGDPQKLDQVYRSAKDWLQEKSS